MSKSSSSITITLIIITIGWNAAIILSNSIREAAKIGTFNDPLNIWWWVGIWLLTYIVAFAEYHLKLIE